MVKKLILIILLGLLTFGGAFAVAWFTKGAPQQAVADTIADGEVAASGQESALPQPVVEVAEAGEATESRAGKAITKNQLKDLVYEVRHKAEEYESKLKTLEAREQRLKKSHDMIKEDIEELNNLRVEISSAVTSLKNERDRLSKSMIDISKTEKQNLVTIAASYDKMKSAGACQILTNMSKIESSRGRSGIDDAVKILYYMTERSRAKLLAELVKTEPQLAALFCQKLKKTVERN